VRGAPNLETPKLKPIADECKFQFIVVDHENFPLDLTREYQEPASDDTAVYVLIVAAVAHLPKSPQFHGKPQFLAV
jgi:hypothetical protein